MSSTSTQQPSDEPSDLSRQLDWHKKGRQGCAFAARLASGVLKAQAGGFYSDYWARKILDGNHAEFAGAMKAFVDESHQNPQRQVVSFLLPGVTTKEQLIALIKQIRAGYAGALVEIHDCPSSPHALVRIRLPLSDGVSAYALGFGPFDWMPETRRAPCTELVLPVKTKQQLKATYGRHTIYQPQADSVHRDEDPTFVHLADIEMEGITRDTPTDKRLWEATTGIKRAKLNAVDDKRAKGKVTFSFEGSTAALFG